MKLIIRKRRSASPTSFGATSRHPPPYGVAHFIMHEVQDDTHVPFENLQRKQKSHPELSLITRSSEIERTQNLGIRPVTATPKKNCIGVPKSFGWLTATTVWLVNMVLMDHSLFDLSGLWMSGAPRAC